MGLNGDDLSIQAHYIGNDIVEITIENPVEDNTSKDDISSTKQTSQYKNHLMKSLSHLATMTIKK